MNRTLQASVKYISLILCVLQNTLLVIQIRYTRIQEGPRYFTSTAVIMSEITKAICCAIVILIQVGPTKLYDDVLGEGLAVFKVAVPAGIYAIQNNLLYYGLSNLEAPVYQVSNQLKVFTTAIFFVIILQQTITVRKWFSLVLLFLGVSMVQLNSLTNTPTVNPDLPEQNPILGAIAVFTASVTSGFAGVYFEKILKSSSNSTWARNIQLGSFGFIFAFLIGYLNDFAEYSSKGFFYGWNFNVVLLVFNHAIGGLIVAFVVRYADNILKGFASSFSIILSSICSVYLFDFRLSWLFVVGTTLVLLACYLYQQQDNVKESEKKDKSPV